MSEEQWVMAFWSLAIVVGFVGSLIAMAWVSEMISKATRHHWPEWDWHSDLKRRRTDRATRTRAGIREVRR